MNFKTHSNLIGKHALLAPSKYHWIGYTPERLEAYVHNMGAAKRGEELHNFAAQCIRLGQKLPRSVKSLNAFVNDAIGYRMTPEQPLYYSDNCFGHTDAISYRQNYLRIHDYKSGILPGNMNQLMVYAALFYLDYRLEPEKNKTELRIYQADEIPTLEPDPKDIRNIMNIIIESDKIVTNIKAKE